MPGHSESRRRRAVAASAASGAAKRDLKAEALRIAAADGPAVASRETGVGASTIRSWQARAKAKGESVGHAPVSSSPSVEGSADRAQSRRVEAERERAAQRTARDQADVLL